MKKQRIASLFLAISLAVSSLAMAVSAKESETVISTSDYIKNVEHTPEIEKVTPNQNGNKFLTVYDRNYQWTGAKVQFEAKPDTTYTFTFRARLTVDSEAVGGKVPQLRAMPYDPKGDCVKIKDSTSHLSLRNIVSDGTWTYYKIENMFVTTEGTAMILLLPYGANNHWYSFDIDDICIMDSEGNTLVYNNFDTYDVGAMEGDQTLTDAFGGKIINYRYDGTFTTSFAINQDNTYYAVDVANGEALTANVNKELEAGTYTYSVKLRNDEFKGVAPYVASGANNNKFSAYALAYTADGTVIGSADNTVTVGDVWTDLNFEFTLDEAATVSSIKIFATHAVENHGNIKVNIKEMKFAGTSLSASIYASVANDIPATVKVSPSQDGNKFLTVHNINYQWAGAKIEFPAKTGAVYTLTFRARLTVDTDDVGTAIPQLRVMAYDPKGTCVNINGSKSHLSMKGIKSDGSWQYYEIKNMKVAEDGTAMLPLLPYSANYHWYSFDIDDVKIVDADGNTVVYNDFNSYDLGVMSGDQTLDANGGVIKTYRYDGSAKHTAAFAINQDDTYYEIDVASGKALTANINKELEAGTYTYSLKLRNDEFKNGAGYMTATTGGVNNNKFTAYTYVTVGIPRYCGIFSTIQQLFFFFTI